MCREGAFFPPCPSFVRVLDSQSDTRRPSTIVQRERGKTDISQKGPPEGDLLSVNGRQGCVHSYNIASLSLSFFLSFSLSLSLSLSAIYLQTKYGQNRHFFHKKCTLHTLSATYLKAQYSTKSAQDLLTDDGRRGRIRRERKH